MRTARMVLVFMVVLVWVVRSGVQWLDAFHPLHRNLSNVLGVEVHFHQVHHSDLTVVVGAEIEPLRLEIARTRPDRIVGKDVSVLVLLMFTGRAFWNVELVQDVERLKKRIIPGLWLENRLAKRDGANEARWRCEISWQPEHARALAGWQELHRSQLHRRSVGHREIQIVAQISHMPIKRGRVGNNAQWVVMDVELAADILDHDASAGSVMHDVVRLRSEAPSAEYDGRDNDVADVSLHFLDAGEVLQYPRSHFPLCNGLARIGCGVGHVSSGGGEIERPGGQAFFI